MIDFVTAPAVSRCVGRRGRGTFPIALLMPRAVPVTLTAAERHALKKRVRGAKTCWRDRLRAQVVLAA
jgi:hypothetical protein